MTSQQIMQDSRVARVRELKEEVARLNQEIARTREELEGLRRHFALALLAARDGESLAPGGTLLVVDGWNAILGSERAVERRPGGEWREELAAKVEEWLAGHPDDRAWIVFDGPDARGEARGRLRISYTGGGGEHRADRLVCDYLRMRRYGGARGRVVVVTGDKDFRAEAERLGAQTEGVGRWTGR